MSRKLKVYEEESSGSLTEKLIDPATTFAALVNSTGGTANDTVTDTGPLFNQTTLNNNFADLCAKLSALRLAFIRAGIIASA